MHHYQIALGLVVQYASRLPATLAGTAVGELGLLIIAATASRLAKGSVLSFGGRHEASTSSIASASRCFNFAL